mmetsp:Transcript_58780/g.140107  ORF Transcript_58780/g.140107 Transcript_58780/m.140107 type:complete len:84 (+) Transcript_58780:673-924(+)
MVVLHQLVVKAATPWFLPRVKVLLLPFRLLQTIVAKARLRIFGRGVLEVILILAGFLASTLTGGRAACTKRLAGFATCASLVT